jgi:hypothetical protein
VSVWEQIKVLATSPDEAPQFCDMLIDFIDEKYLGTNVAYASLDVIRQAISASGAGVSFSKH